jgi:hypothetical protein
MGGLPPILQFLGARSKIKSNAKEIENKRGKKMSGTVNYPKVIDHLTDVIKELNVPCAEPPAPATAAERHADAVDLLRGLLNKLESHDADAHAAAAAEHGATDQGFKSGLRALQGILSNRNKPATSAPAPAAPAPAAPAAPAAPVFVNGFYAAAKGGVGTGRIG